MNDGATIALALTVNLGAMVSPGPDFLIVLRNALEHGRRAGIYTAVGIATGLAVHMAYCIAGIALVISRSIMLFNIIKWVGAAYLVYVGWQALRSRGMDIDAMKRRIGTGGAPDMAMLSSRKAYGMGFFTNIFNPKATLFFLALWTQVIGPSSMPVAHQAILACGVIMMGASWFSLVTLVMTMPAVRAQYARASKWVDRVTGGLFIALGLKLAVARL